MHPASVNDLSPAGLPHRMHVDQAGGAQTT